MGLTFAAKRRRRFWRLRNLVVLVVVARRRRRRVFVVVDNDAARPSPPLPTAQVDAFLRAWGAGNAAAMAAQLDAPPAEPRRPPRLSLVKAAPGSKARYTRTTLVRDPIGDGATATYHAHVDVAGFGPLDWNGVLPVVRVQQTEGRDGVADPLAARHPLSRVSPTAST